MATRGPDRGTTTPPGTRPEAGGEIREPDPGGSDTGRWVAWIVGAAILIGAIVWIVLAAADDSPGPEQGASVESIVEEPGDFIGETVTVSGAVESTLVTPGAFTIGEDVNEGVIVVLPTADAQVPAEITEGDAVQVTGEVSAVTSTTADEDDFLFETGDGDDEFLTEFEGQPLLSATQIDTTVPEETENGGG